MTNNKPLSLAVAILLKIGQKHKAAASFSLTSLLGEMERDFDDGKLALDCGFDNIKYSYFPNGLAYKIASELFEHKLIPDYVLDGADLARWWTFVDISSQAGETEKLIRSVERDNKSLTSKQICDSEDAKLLNDVVEASSRAIVNGRERDEVERKVYDILYDYLCIDRSTTNLSSKLREDLGSDSLDELEILMAIEEDFDMAIPESEIENIKTVGEIVDYLMGKKLNVESEDDTDNIIARASQQESNMLQSIKEDLSEEITKYVLSQGGVGLAGIGNWMDGCDDWNEERVRSFIEQNCQNLSIRDGFVYFNEARETKLAPQRELNAELILKYLKNKGGRATLKQIQSRFKSYLNNTCREIKDLVSRETNCIVVFSGKQSQCEVVLSETWNESV